MYKKTCQVGAPANGFLIGDHVVEDNKSRNARIAYAVLGNSRTLALYQPVEYILPQPLHNVPLRQYLFPVARVRRVTHNDAKRDILTAMKSNIGDGGTFACAALAEKSHRRVVGEILRYARPFIDRSSNRGERFGSHHYAAVAPITCRVHLSPLVSSALWRTRLCRWWCIVGCCWFRFFLFLRTLRPFHVAGVRSVVSMEEKESKHLQRVC